MRVTVNFDYPDHLIETHGEADAAATIAARLEECYPGNDGAVLRLGTGGSDAEDPALVIGVGGRTWFADAGGVTEVQGTGELTDGPVVVDGDVTFTPWTDGRAVGWRALKDGREPEFLLLNPSDRGGDADDHATVFLYWGRHGSADLDDSLTHVEVHRGDG